MQLNTYFKAFVAPPATGLGGLNVRPQGASLGGRNFPARGMYLRARNMDLTD
jgi:hypothetical protein